ncbi:MAG: NAD-dependent deacylase [Candidatus Eisenbacteria sp.]|nr:NAD-dependent deacylase [Candidatus Eisenbacteria bacterium]
MDKRVERAADLIRQARHAIAFTGSGISAESGIPTYRGAGGVWHKYDPAKYASIDYFLKDPSYWWRFFRELRGPLLQKARPNQGHLALARLEAEGHLPAVITQNIDGLHQAAGSRNVIELHGTARRTSCMDCGTAFPIDEILPILDREIPPRCPRCEGNLRPSVILFGEALPPDALEKADHETRAADLVIVVGSSLAVYPAASIPEMAKTNGAGLIIVNVDPTPMDSVADVVFHNSAGTVLPQIVARI